MKGVALLVPAFVCAAAIGHCATFDELAMQAATARRSGDIPQAIAFYHQALDKNADWPEGWWFLGTLSYSAYRFAGCQNALTEFVHRSGGQALAWAVLGLCEFETGAYNKALGHLQRGLAPHSGLPPEIEVGVRFHYGLLLTRAGQFDRALRQLERFAHAGAGEPMAVLGMGLNALREPLLPKEVPAGRQELLLAAGRAISAWILNDRETAQGELRKLAHDYPAERGVHYLYGTFLGSAAPKEAIAEFQCELELNPENADALARLALLLMPGNQGAALADARTAATEEPSDAFAAFAYGKLLVETGAVTPGIERLENAIRLDPATLKYHLTLAGAYSKAGRDTDARRERRLSLDIAKSPVTGD